MPESSIQQLLTSTNRKWFIGGTTALLCIVLGLAANKELSSLGTEKAELRNRILETSRSVSNLPNLQLRLSQLTEANQQNLRGVSPELAGQLQERVVRLIHRSGCRLLKAKLGEVREMLWDGNSDPLLTKDVAKHMDKPHVLTTIKLHISAEGSLKNLDRLIGELHAMHALAVPSGFSLRHDDYNDMLTLETELTLLDLSSKPLK